MSERPPIPVVLTPWQVHNLEASLKRVKDVFTERYPGARSIVHVDMQNASVYWSISHHENGECTLGNGATPENAFADLDEKLGPPMTPAERLRFRCEQLMKEAIALEAYEVASALKAAQQTTLPDSSPALQ